MQRNKSKPEYNEPQLIMCKAYQDVPKQQRYKKGKYIRILEEFIESNLDIVVVFNISNLYNAYHGFYFNIRKHNYPVKPLCRNGYIYLRRIRDEYSEEKSKYMKT